MKKLIIGIGSLTTIAAPAIMVVSCGSKNDSSTNINGITSTVKYVSGDSISFDKESDTVALFVQGGPQVGNHLPFANVKKSGKGEGFMYDNSMTDWIEGLFTAKFVNQKNWNTFKDIRDIESQYYNNIFSTSKNNDLKDISLLTDAHAHDLVNEVVNFFHDSDNAKEIINKNVDNIKNAIHYYHSINKKVVLIGQSFGGFLLTYILDKHAEILNNVDKLVISASRYQLGKYVKSEDNAFNIEDVKKKSNPKDPSFFDNLLDNYSQSQLQMFFKDIDITKKTLSDELKNKTLFIYNDSDEGVQKLNTDEKTWVNKYNFYDATNDVAQVTSKMTSDDWKYPYTHAYLFNNEAVHTKVLEFLNKK